MRRNVCGIAIALSAGFPMHYVYSAEITYCSPHGDGSADVILGVQVAKAGRISLGQAVSLRIAPKDVCDPGANCQVPRSSPLPGFAQGVELGRNQSWVCVGVPGKRPLDVWFGWIPERRWQRTDSGQESTSRWLGVWQNDGAKIKIQSSDGQNLSVTGDAIWTGGVLGSSNFGNFQLVGIPANGVLATDSVEHATGCQVALRIVGNFLVAADNQQCGGMNVSFNGVYRFRRALH